MNANLILYIVKRILVMIPTIFVIALVCFIVLNFAPGKPGAAGEAAQAAGSEEARAQYRLFKEFFNYDKPVLFNTYFWVEESEVQNLFDVSLDPDALPKDKIEAQNRLEDYGIFIIPHLMTMMNNAREAIDSAKSPEDRAAAEEVERLAVYQLSVNGRKRNLFLGRETDVPEDIKDAQREIGRHNQMISRWRYDDSMSEEKKTELRDSWNDWYEDNRADRFEFDTGDRIAIFFTDTRFYKYMSNLLQGELGYTMRKDPVMPEILKRVKLSFVLSFIAIILTYFLAVPLGIFSSVKQHSTGDQVLTVVLFLLYSLPSFFVATLMVQYIPHGEPFFTHGFETSKVVDPYMTTGERLWDITMHLVLPVICLSYGGLAALSRYARTGLLDVIRADYIRTARAKGLAEPVVILKHAARNGMIPILTLLGTLLPALFGGSIVIEFIFEIDGIGKYMLEAIALRDYTVVMGILLISAVMTLIGLLLSDISYALVDPRITFD